MNNYHFYEEIGKGKHSMVYRCRKKKCVEFCAIKSVDKVSRGKVLNEVMVLNSLHHRNVLKFHTWYETKNHIWLIMEYCTGGDLLNVLLQDTKLPESAICDFGYDLMDGLQYIHSKSVVCCDLKPSNILLDEDGTLKFSDFGLSQLLGDIGGHAGEQSKRGTPCYMAPELFRDDGYHSFASDFWALGCVLYEMAAGRPPFVSSSFRDLMDQILNNDYPPIAGSSSEFNELLQQLLNKDRFCRMVWPELLSTPFWTDGERGAPAPMRLPGQPRFDSEKDAVRRQQAAEDDEVAAVAAQLESRKRGGRSGGEVDVLRLSRAANSNLAKEVAQAQEGDGDDGGYGSTADAATPEPAVEDVQLAGPDVELNFSDSAAGDRVAADKTAAGGGDDDDDGAPGESQGDAADRNSELARVESAVAENDSEVPAESVAAAAAADEDEEEEEIEIDEEEPIGPIRVVERPAVSGPGGEDSGATTPRNRGSRPVTAPETGPSLPPPVVDPAAAATSAASTATPGGSEQQPPPVRPATTATSTRAEQEDKDKSAGGANARRRGGRGDGGASGSPTAPPLAKIMYHASDSGVKPIVNNKRIERIVVPTSYDRNALPFQARTLQEMLELAEHDTVELEQFLTSIFRSVGGPVPVAKKVNTLAYFESLCIDTNAANILINSSLMSLFVKMAKAFKSPTLKVRLATAMGLLIRHATYITEQLSEAGLVDALSTMVQDKHETVRRRSCATLGELLFYVATQNKQDVAATGSGGVWAVPGNVFGILIRCLRDSDEIVQHYAAKAIENMATAASQEYFVRLCRSDTVTELLTVVNISSSDGLRSTAISAMARLIKRSPSLSLVAPLMEKHGVRWMMEAMVESHPKIQQAALTILLQALQDPSSRLVKSLESERALTQTLVKLSEHATPAIRGKALLGALLCSRKVGMKWLARACEAKLLPNLEKILVRDADNYPRQCATCLADGLVELAPTVLAQQARLLQQRPGSSRPASRGRPASSGGGGSVGSDFTVLHHLTTSPHLLARLGTTQTLTQLGDFLQMVTKRKLGSASFKSELLLVVEAFTQHSPTLLREWEAVLTSLCPALASLLRTHDGDTRFFALQKFSDIMLTYVNEPSLYVPSEASPPPVEGAAATAGMDPRMATATVDKLLREAAELLVDEDPIPLYALKLLSAVMERSPGLAMEAEPLGLLPLTVQFLRLDHPNNNIHNLRLIEALVQCGTVTMGTDTQGASGTSGNGCVAALYSLGLAESLVAVLDYAYENQVDSFFESVLGIVLCLLSIDGERGGGEVQQWNATFCDAMECLLALLGHVDAGVGELAAACLVALVKQIPSTRARALETLSQPHAVDALANALDGADAAVQSLVLDLALRLARGGVGRAQLSSLARAAARLAGGGGAGTDPNVAGLAQQLVAEAGSG